MFQLDEVQYRVDVIKDKTDVTSCLAVKTGLTLTKPAVVDRRSHFFANLHGLSWGSLNYLRSKVMRLRVKS